MRPGRGGTPSLCPPPPDEPQSRMAPASQRLEARRCVAFPTLCKVTMRRMSAILALARGARTWHARCCDKDRIDIADAPHEPGPRAYRRHPDVRGLEDLGAVVAGLFSTTRDETG